tara:strand:+ start:12230 stop:12472 length:243 start_codon:yes stop_codon:yes gene_type:complete
VVALEDSIVFQITHSEEQILRSLDNKFKKYFGINAEKRSAFLQNDLFLAEHFQQKKDMSTSLKTTLNLSIGFRNTHWHPI